jgi:type I restriction enzyme R subunit
MSKANELSFQNDMIAQPQAHGWLLGKAEHDNRELVLPAVPSENDTGEFAL